MKKMTIDEMISRYDIQDGAEYGRPGSIAMMDQGAVRRDGRAEVMAMLKENKSDILAELAARKRTKEERQDKIDAIPGLEEIRDAQYALDEWRDKFRRSFDGEGACGGYGVGKRPTVDIDALKAQYPIAAAYLQMETRAHSTNFEIAGIGRRAIDTLVKEYDYTAALAQMEAEIAAFKERHAWD